MSTLRKSSLAYIGLVVVTLIIGLSFVFVKIGLRHAGSMDLLAHRFSAAAVVVLLLWLFGFIKLPPFSFAKAKYLLLLSLFYPLLFFSLQTFGLANSTASEAGIIFATTPIITLMAASIFLKERTTMLQKLGILLSIAGIVYIICFRGDTTGGTTPIGFLLLMLSVLSLVLYYVLGRVISARFTAIEITVWMILLAFVAFNGFSVASHIHNDSLNQYFAPLLHKEFLWSILYLGVLSSLVTAFLTNFALSAVPASQIAVFNNLNPIFSIAGGILILNETLYSYHLVGAALVLVGLLMTVFFAKRKE